MSSPKILHLSTYDAHGGAARAAVAIHDSLASAGVDSHMQIAEADSLRFKLAKEADRRLWKLQKSETLTWRSPARFGSLTAREINNSGADIVHLHWVTDGFMTIETIGQIRKPIVWSLCDAWAFSGSEHYATRTSEVRFREGYTAANRQPGDSGFDLDRWTWNRKMKNWGKPMQLVPASSWLTQALESSRLMGHWPSTRLPHIVDTEKFKPQDEPQERSKPVVLFLASGGIHDARKGWDLLAQALANDEVTTPLRVVVVGPEPSPADQAEIRRNMNHEFIFYGEARGDLELISLYQNADITIVPSREDNLPITAMESQSCGTPVVGFSIGGLPDIVSHEVTGYLARPEDPEDLARGINYALENDLGINARARALSTWSPETVVPQLLVVYEQAMVGGS